MRIALLWLPVWLSLAACTNPPVPTANPALGTDAGGTGSEAGTGNGSSGAGSAGSAGNASANADGGQAGTNADASTTPIDQDASAPPCTLACADGQVCELVQVQCFRAPCPPQPTCVTAADGGSSSGTDCDLRKILCKRVQPQCPDGQVPSVSGLCYGDCVPVETCSCNEPAGCPDSNHYTCHMSAGHCGPYL